MGTVTLTAAEEKLLCPLSSLPDSQASVLLHTADTEAAGTGTDTAAVQVYGTVRRHLSAGCKVALLWLLAVALACILAPWLSPHGPQDFFFTAISKSPDARFWLGTDPLGQDLFSLLLYGGRSSMLIGLLAALTACVLGLGAGIASGLAPARLDALLQRLMELLQSVPATLYLLVLTSLSGRQNEYSLAVLIGSCTWFSLARLVRAQVRQLRTARFLEAARAAGCSTWLMIRLHLLPSVLTTQSFVLAASFAGSLAHEATLSFLGLGLPPEVVSWGSLLSLSGRALLCNAWWVILFPGLLLLSVLGAVSVLCAQLRRPLRLRGSNL